MKKAGIIAFLLIITSVIIIVVVSDFRSGKVDRRGGNIYELDVDQYKPVDPELVSHKEIRNYRIDARAVSGLAYADQKLYVVADDFIQVFDILGTQIMKSVFQENPTCTAVMSDGTILVGFRNKLGLYSTEGEKLWLTDTIDQRTVITNIAVHGEDIFVADAGKRMVHRYDPKGNLLGQFEGKTGGKDLHGFIVPSANFDLDLNEDGELWVVNPGKHALENYTMDGELRGFWENSSVKIEGFSGCCNPAHIAFLPDGSFVTSEKGLVRIKIHKASGEFVSVVASPELFDDDGEAPDVVADEKGNIYALDHERKIIRLFSTL